MKTYLALLSAAVLSLSACSQESPAPSEQPAETAVEASAAVETDDVSSAPTPSADAQDVVCNMVVESDDAMRFNTDEINISKACQEYTITLKHVGKIPKAAMGHNLVIAKTEDVDGIVKDGAAAQIDNGYLKVGDERIIAATELIGGGEETTVTVDTSKLANGEKYEFFCSFPGHIGLMRGTVNLVD
ncbi:azurin [Neisseria montereyensis]|uniref:Azurin n=1 Tax=Neisseria montereyensis TaxID=2973938 RepID=A0ABT2FBW7_9NEIS|nr:azurin [Neisseria montereyensis]MCS4533465.1 azurin [Neisseria montereyensis]